MTEEHTLQRQLPSSKTHDLAVFLDVDGTLLDIQRTPEAVTVPPELIPVLDTTHQVLSGALALISGRPLAELDRLFAPLVLPAAGLMVLALLIRLLTQRDLALYLGALSVLMIAGGCVAGDGLLSVRTRIDNVKDHVSSGLEAVILGALKIVLGLCAVGVAAYVGVSFLSET